MPTGSHFTATLHGESVADRHRARPCAAHSLRLRSPRRFSSRERWEGIEHHAAPRPPLDLAAGAVRDHRVLAESGTAERAVEAELAQHRQRVGGRLPGERSEEHTSELQSLTNLVCRLLLEKKNKKRQ